MIFTSLVLVTIFLRNTSSISLRIPSKAFRALAPSSREKPPFRTAPLASSCSLTPYDSSASARAWASARSSSFSMHPFLTDQHMIRGARQKIGTYLVQFLEQDSETSRIVWREERVSKAAWLHCSIFGAEVCVEAGLGASG